MFAVKLFEKVIISPIFVTLFEIFCWSWSFMTHDFMAFIYISVLSQRFSVFFVQLLPRQASYCLCYKFLLMFIYKLLVISIRKKQAFMY